MNNLLLAIILSTLIIITFRIMGKKNINNLYAITFNYLFATILGFLFWVEPLSAKLITGKSWFWLSILIGVFFIITFFLISKSTAKAGVAITAVAGRMSVIIPVISGFLLFDERLSLSKIAGVILIMISFYLIFIPGLKTKTDWRLILLPILMFIGVGTNDTLMKYVDFHYLNGDLSVFLMMVFFIAFSIGLLVSLFIFIEFKTKPCLNSILAGLILGSLNFGSTFFFIKSMKYFDPSFLFPVVSAGIVILSVSAGMLFFGEKPGKISLIGIVVAIIAIIIISNG